MSNYSIVFHKMQEKSAIRNKFFSKRIDKKKFTVYNNLHNT